MKDVTPKPVPRMLEIEADVFPVDAAPLFMSVAGGNFTGENIEGWFATGIGGASIIVCLTKPEKRTVVVSARGHRRGARSGGWRTRRGCRGRGEDLR